MPRLLILVVRLLAGLLILLMIAFAVDYAVLRLRAVQTSSVTVHPYLAVPKKDGGTEFMFEDPRDQSCVNALFPHLGQSPCWYVRRHAEQRINL